MGQSRIFIERQIESRFLDQTRTIRISLPVDYEHSRKRYPVLYLHDGQNIFSYAGPHCCFGWGSWEVDLIVGRLVAESRMRDIILVGVDNSRSRYTEYRGPAHRSRAEDSPRSKRGADSEEDSDFEHYSAFLMKEVKPLIDKEYRTLPRAGTTGLMGSSLGGICSLALAWKHPAVFGLSASLSSSFQIEHTYFLKGVLQKYRGKPKNVRVYLDSGTFDSGGDDDGRQHTAEVADELRRIGWKNGSKLMHFVEETRLTEEDMDRAGLSRDKWHEALGSQHNEFYWRHRLWRPLTFLFPPTR